MTDDTDSEVGDEAVTIESYRPEWAQQGAELVRQVTAVVGTMAQDVQHIGSTADPALAGKPMVDVAGAVLPSQWEDAVASLVHLGFQDLASIHRGTSRG